MAGECCGLLKGCYGNAGEAIRSASLRIWYCFLLRYIILDSSSQFGKAQIVIQIFRIYEIHN